MLTFIVATRNPHKVEEIRAVLSDSLRYRTLRDLPNPPSVVEDAHTFAGNAAKKSLDLARWLAAHPLALAAAIGNETSPQVCCLADDSGLEVDALGGAPGVHSARFAALDCGQAANSSDADNNAKLLRLLEHVPLTQRTARFRCCIALTPVLLSAGEAASQVCLAEEAELRTEVFDGACEGHIDLTPRGTGGFGYDPLFVPRGFAQSFGELGSDVKNRISHRAQALGKVREWLHRQGAA